MKVKLLTAYEFVQNVPGSSVTWRASSPGPQPISPTGIATFNGFRASDNGTSSYADFPATLNPNFQINVTEATAVPLESDALPVVGSALFMAGGLWWKKKRAQAKATEFIAKQ